MITSPPSFSSVACLGLGPFFRSVTAGLRLFTVVPSANYRFLFIGSAAAGLRCFLLFWLSTVGQRFLFHCQVNGCPTARSMGAPLPPHLWLAPRSSVSSGWHTKNAPWSSRNEIMTPLSESVSSTRTFLGSRQATSILPLTICRTSSNDAETLNPSSFTNLPITAAVNLPGLRGRVFFVPRGTTGSLASVVGIAISLAGWLLSSSDVSLADPSYQEDRR
jgi:hypothetical protein